MYAVIVLKVHEYDNEYNISFEKLTYDDVVHSRLPEIKG